MKRYNQQVYQTGRYKKEPEPRILTEREQWAIVDRKHKLVFHRDGHNLLFSRKKDADAWMIKHRLDIPEDWRILKVETSITTVLSS